MTHKISVKGRIGLVTVTGGAIDLEIVCQYGTICVPVRGFLLEEIELVNDDFYIDIDLILPDWIVS